jgi:hypothetical protein
MDIDIPEAWKIQNRQKIFFKNLYQDTFIRDNFENNKKKVIHHIQGRVYNGRSTFLSNASWARRQVGSYIQNVKNKPQEQSKTY